VTRDLGPDTLIEALVAARYDEVGDSTKENLFNELKEHNYELAEAGSTLRVSDTAIKGWFKRPKPSPPTRRVALDFLHSFVERILQQATSAMTEPRKAALHEIRACLESLTRAVVRPAPKKRRQRVGSIGAWDVKDTEAPAQFRAIAGDYQIVRPHSSNPDEYVLEAMSIEVDETTRRATLRMYSHTQASSEFMYSGALYISHRYGFSLIQRKHDLNPDRLALRSLVLYVESKKVGPRFAASPCLSGIMLRSVSGQGGAGVARAIGAPFVAIKAPDTRNFAEPDFITRPDALLELHTGRDLLIGEVANSNVLFSFCNRVFSQIKFQSGLIIQTVPPKTLRKIIRSDMSGDDVYFAEWATAVSQH
jgi:hypothetical protein